MFDYKKNLQSHGMKIEKVFLYRKYKLFLQVAKNFGINLKQKNSLYYCTISYYFQNQVLTLQCLVVTKRSHIL